MEAVCASKHQKIILKHVFMPCDFYKALYASVEVGCCKIGRLIDCAAKSLLENWDLSEKETVHTRESS